MTDRHWHDTWHAAQRVVGRKAPDLLDMLGLVGEPPAWNTMPLGQAHTDNAIITTPRWEDKTWTD